MAQVNAWLTPECIPTVGANCRPLFVPDCEEFRAAIEGAILLLCDPDNWEQFGAATPDECAAAAYAMYQTFIARRSCMPIGTVVFHAGSDIPDHMLLCDGSEVDQDDYPLLYDAIGDTYGSAAAGYFRLPDLIDAIPYGGNIVDLGTDVGVNDLILTLDQIPGHTHQVMYVNLGITMVTTGPAPIIAISDAGYIASGSAGGGESFDNRQAGVTMLPCIIAR